MVGHNLTNSLFMTQYSILLNKKGTILSCSVTDADESRFPVKKKLTGRHFSYLIGMDCKKDLRSIIQETTKSRKPSNFKTFFSPQGSHEGPLVEWTMIPKSTSILLPTRYLLIGKAEE